MKCTLHWLVYKSKNSTVNCIKSIDNQSSSIPTFEKESYRYLWVSGWNSLNNLFFYFY